VNRRGASAIAGIATNNKQAPLRIRTTVLTAKPLPSNRLRSVAALH